MATIHPSTSQTQAVAVVEAENRILASEFGYFRKEDYAYVMTRLDTPRPWVNVMSNGRYGLVVSHTGGGFSWLDNSQIFRLNRWEQDLSTDAYGRFVFISDATSNELWSTTYAPTRVRAEKEEVIHGIGWTEFRRQNRSVQSVHRLTVDTEQNFEIHVVELTNTSSQPIQLTIGTYLDWHLGSIGEWHREFHRLFTSVEVHNTWAGAFKRPGLTENERHATSPSHMGFSALIGVESADWFVDKVDWIGRLSTEASPDAMTSRRAPQVTGRWDDPIAASRFNITLQPGESKSFGWVVGVEADADAVGSVLKGLTLGDLSRRFERAKKLNEERAGQLKLTSSDTCMDLLNNGWLPHQAFVGRMLARSAYYQQGGAYGFRDQLQDSLSLLDTNPAHTFEQIVRNAGQTYEDGGVRHWWHPNTDIFAESRHSDTCLWVSYAVLEYLDETGNLDSLKTPVNYLSRQSQEKAGERSLLDQCLAGISRSLSLRSPRGLNLIGAGDWNDGLSHAGLDGKGESVWVSMFLHHILLRFAPYLRSLNMSDQADEFEREAASLKAAVNEHGWDGEWYIAGTSDDGRAFGSKSCSEGKIFLNPQTWAIISGIATPERARIALESVKKHLLKPYGALLLAPAFHNVDPYIGYITRYAPGLRENGGVYSHAATWAVEAFALAGDQETAYAVYQSLCPPLRSVADAERYACEPYVMPGNSDGPDSPHEGQGGWTWYTGSASWMRRVFLRSILGLRATGDGLNINNHLPTELDRVNLVRNFRGDLVRIGLAGSGRGQHHLVRPTGVGREQIVDLT